MTAQELRHHLHQHPELSGEEHKTQSLVYNLVKGFKPDKLEKVGGTSLLAHFDSGRAGAHILFRADYDALPIQEDLDLEYKSQQLGVSHKCGHDGHTAILYRFLELCKDEPLQRGKLSVLFQASEENGQGAKKVLDDPIFRDYDYQQAFALHNIPGYPLGEVLWRNENFSAGVSSLSMEWKGLATHAAHPWEGRNPALLISNTIAKARELENTETNSADFFLCTPVYAHLGDKDYGISPGKGGLHFTARAWQGKLLEENIEALKEEAHHESEKGDLKLDIQRFEEFWPIVNSTEANAAITEAANQANLSKRELETPFSWGEDFGLFLKDKSGAMFGLGSGEDCKVLHHPEYNFPDELIEKGARVFLEIYRQHCHD